jgi:hypothetical protein
MVAAGFIKRHEARSFPNRADDEGIVAQQQSVAAWRSGNRRSAEPKRSEGKRDDPVPERVAAAAQLNVWGSGELPLRQLSARLPIRLIRAAAGP